MARTWAPPVEIPKNEREVCLQLLSLFQIEGKPANEMATQGQIEIFWAIVFKPKLRVEILCSTQYGKSLFVAFGCIILSCIQEEMVCVLAPTNDKARIIMRYYIEHLGDNPMFYTQLEAHTKLERLKREESKERIILRNGGGLFTVSVQAGNTMRRVEAAMGMGAKNVIDDEACLIPDDAEASVFRMLAGKGPDAFYCKIGNPWYRDMPYTHFYNTWQDPTYLHIFIDYVRAIEEGRYTESFIEEAKSRPNFDILFGCQFPEEGQSNADGWTPLLIKEDIDNAMKGIEGIKHAGERGHGVDVAGEGANNSVIVQRSFTFAEILLHSPSINEIQLAGHIMTFVQDCDISPYNVLIDNSGIGQATVHRLSEQHHACTPVNVAERASEPKRYFNLRAEAYWKMREWIKGGGKLSDDPLWYTLLDVKYKVNSSGQIQIMPKDVMRKYNIQSPDVPDALMHTFTKPLHSNMPDQEDVFFAKKMRNNRFKNKTYANIR